MYFVFKQSLILFQHKIPKRIFFLKPFENNFDCLTLKPISDRKKRKKERMKRKDRKEEGNNESKNDSKTDRKNKRKSENEKQKIE